MGDPEPVGEAGPESSRREVLGDAAAAVRSAIVRLDGMAALEARVDQVRARIREAAKRERLNPVLVQLCLDVENDLHGPYPENAEGGG